MKTWQDSIQRRKKIQYLHVDKQVGLGAVAQDKSQQGFRKGQMSLFSTKV